MAEDDFERLAALPINLKAQLDEAVAKLTALEKAGLMDLEKEQVSRLKAILQEDNERAIVYAYVRKRFRVWGAIVIFGAATLAAFREDVGQLMQFVRDILPHRPPPTP